MVNRDCSTRAKDELKNRVCIKYIISTKVASIYTTGRHRKKLNFRKCLRKEMVSMIGYLLGVFPRDIAGS